MRQPMLILALFFGLTSCDKPERVISSTAYTKKGVVVAHAGGFEARVMQALGKIDSEALSKDAAEKIKANKGKVLIDDLTKISGLPDGVEASGLFEDEAVKAALMGTNEVEAADLLYNNGVRTVIVHHTLSPSTDVGSRVLARLIHHDYLVRFQLVRVTETALIYRVRKAAVVFPQGLAESTMRYIRERLKGQPPVAVPDLKSETGNWTFVATLRGQGRELAFAFAQDRNLQKAMEELVVDLERRHRRRVEYYGFPPLKDHIDDLHIEVQRVIERAFIENRDDDFLARFWELGADGVYYLSADRKKRGVAPGSFAYTRSLNRPDKFLKAAAKHSRMQVNRPWREAGSWFEVFRTIHYAEVGDNRVVPLFRGFKMVPESAVTIESVRQAVIRSGEWYLANLQPDGSVVYKFWPSENRYANENNIVRHTLSTWNLVQAYELEPRPEFLEAAKATLGFTQSHLIEETDAEHGEMALYRFNNNQKLGTVVINILGIVDLARASGSKEYDSLLRKLGNFTKFMAEDNGRFLGYHVPKGHKYHGRTNDIVPGEAALALIYLAEYFDDDSWIEDLDKYWAYYMPLFRERAAKKHDTAPWPNHIYDNDMRLALVQMGPWTVMAANAYHARTGNKEVAAFGLEVARWMIDTYQWRPDRTPWPDYTGGYFKMSEELPAMQAFCYAEGTAAAYQLAIRFDPEQSSFFEKSTREAMRLGLAMQYTEDDTYAFSRPYQVMGGIRYALNETKVRIDYVHHGLSSMYQYVKGAQMDPQLPESVRGDYPAPK